MNYRNLLVHLDDSQAARQRLEIALRVARQFDAQLVGLYITPIPDAHILSAIPGAASMYAEVMRQSDQQRAALRDLLDAECRHADVAGQFRCATRATCVASCGTRVRLTLSSPASRIRTSPKHTSTITLANS
ncbi:universal stress protein [Paraburkholderia sp. JPY465]|uniref:universal stress protein n=1 Tax=Paraburkholderia sp. JPY465 TaxID=3042285 RepID=UPI003D201179